MNVVKTKRTVKVFTLAMINVAAVCSLKNWPVTAEYGFSSLFFFVLAAALFFIPVSLVAAELATGWPERGGVFVWVKEALGHKLGFLAIWLQWIENVIYYPTLLSFIGATLAYAFNPDLAHNQLYMVCMILAVFWGVTLVNLRGMKLSGVISSIGAVFGTMLPGVFIIGLGVLWWSTGRPLQISLTSQSLIPSLSSPYQLSLFAGVLLGFAGMEMSANHARDVIQPQKNYPKAIFLSACIILFFSVLGTLAIAFVIPQKEISLVSGGIEALKYFMNAYGLGWAVPLLALLMTVGALGTLSTWIVGPSKGLLAAAQSGEFPPILHRVNKHDMPIGMLIMQSVIVSVVSLIFLLMPDVNSSFWILLVMSSQLYLLMYVLMFVAAIVLRYKKPNVKREYRIPGGNFGMWIVAGIGLLGAVGAITIGFFPPDQLNTGSLLVYELFLGGGIVILSIIPFVILAFKKPSWNIP